VQQVQLLLFAPDGEFREGLEARLFSWKASLH